MADDPDVQHLIEAIRREVMPPAPDLEAIIERAVNSALDKRRAEMDSIVEAAATVARKDILHDLGVEDSIAGFDRLRGNMAWISERRALQKTVLEKGIGAAVVLILGALFAAVGFYIRGGSK